MYGGMDGDKKKYKCQLIEYYGYFLAFSLSLTLVIMFYFSYYLNDYVLVININLFGEAHFELILLTIVFIIITCGLYFFCKNIKHRRSFSQKKL